MSYEKFITKDEVADFFDIDDPDEIKEIHMKTGQFTVNSWLRDLGYEPNNYDGSYEDLFMAALFFIAEDLSKIGIITWSVGEIEQENFGAISRRFPRWQPMFFFARGNAKGFYELLPHQTYHMAAIQFMYRFARSHNKETLRVNEALAKDTSHRGYGWDRTPLAGSEIIDIEDDFE